MTRANDIVVDTLDVWQEWLPEFDAERSDEPMTLTEVTAWEKIRDLASRFQRADLIVMGAPMANFCFPYKLKQLIDLTCQRKGCTPARRQCSPRCDGAQIIAKANFSWLSPHLPQGKCPAC